MIRQHGKTECGLPNLGRERDSKQSCWVLDLGWQNYKKSLASQSEIVERRKRSEIPDCLLFVQYAPVITLGRSGNTSHLLASELELQQHGIELFTTDRGGDITYHGPGQLIAYPVLDLKNQRRDIDLYLRHLESCIIATIGDFGISARRIPKLTGVWVREEKIAAIGVRTSQWVTSHGLALNVNTDLNYFKFIVPCGLNSKGVTSMSKILGVEVDIRKVKDRFCHYFAKTFERTLQMTASFTNSKTESSLSDLDKA